MCCNEVLLCTSDVGVQLLVTDEDRKEESDLQERFRQIAGSDLEVDAYELRDLLDSRFKPGKENSCRPLIRAIQNSGASRATMIPEQGDMLHTKLNAT